MIKNPNTQLSHMYPPRASVSGSKASMTIEASFAIPIFLFAVLCLVYLLEIQAIDFKIRAAAQEAAKQEAANLSVLPVLNTYSLQSNIVKLIGEERLDRSIVVEGSSGIWCGTSYYNIEDEEMKIRVKYAISLPFPEFARA